MTERAANLAASAARIVRILGRIERATALTRNLICEGAIIVQHTGDGLGSAVQAHLFSVEGTDVSEMLLKQLHRDAEELSLDDALGSGVQRLREDLGLIDDLIAVLRGTDRDDEKGLGLQEGILRRGDSVSKDGFEVMKVTAVRAPFIVDLLLRLANDLA